MLSTRLMLIISLPPRCFLLACYYLPVLGRIRVLFFGRLCGRNEILSTFVNMVEGDPVFYRSKKRISSLFANLRKVTKRVPPCSEYAAIVVVHSLRARSTLTGS